MSRVWKTLVAAMGIALLAGPAVANEDVESELAEMRRLMEGLQQKVDAQEEQLQEQERNLEEAQKVVKRTQEDQEALSGLSSFLNSVEVDGWISATYSYNVLNDPDNSQAADQPGGGNPGGTGTSSLNQGLNQGASGAFHPFNGDHDTFNINQIWFGLGKPATEESRAGFRFDILYGQTARYLGNGSSTRGRETQRDSTGDFYINKAYIEYLAPIGNGVMFTGGKFGTLAGAEVAETTQNFNITRGNLYNLLQPIDHVGMLVSTEVGPVGITLGAANSQQLGVGTRDDNSEKTLLSQISWGDDTFSAAATVIWGAEFGSNKDDLGIFDTVLTWNPSDELSMWLNADYTWQDGDGTGLRGHAWGIGVAGRYAITDTFGFSLRGEYVEDNSGFLGLTQAASAFRVGNGLTANAGSKDNNHVWSLTATADYTVVDNLMLRLESRYDRANKSQFFTNDDDQVDRDQWVLLAEAVYTF